MLAGQICLLLWKNWLIQRRHFCVSIFEVILPAIFCLFIVNLREHVEPEVHKNPIFFKATKLNKYIPYNITILYVPLSPATAQLMSHVSDLLSTDATGYLSLFIKGFRSQSESLSFAYSDDWSLWQLIIFDNVQDQSNKLPMKLKYSIQPYLTHSEWMTRDTFSENIEPQPKEKAYSYTGVLYMQKIMAEAFAKYWLTQNNRDPGMIRYGVYKKVMAFPPYYSDDLAKMVLPMFPIFVVISFIMNVIMNTKNLVHEKEAQLKESMKLMGLNPTAYWISWFATFCLYLIPAVALFTVTLTADLSGNGPIMRFTDTSILFVFLLLYAFALITFCFMVSTFAQKANTGIVLAALLFVVFGIPYLYFISDYQRTTRLTKLAASLLFNSAMGFGMKILGISEGSGIPTHWSNFHTTEVTADNITILDCMLMMALDGVIYLVIMWYVDNVMPGEFGIPKPYLFFCQKSYWVRSPAENVQTNQENTVSRKYFEVEPTDRKAGIRICNLRKTFGKKVAIAGTSLNMYEGQITVLLGHNGAGKTTTMSVITGFIPPTSGTAIINGYDIRNNIEGVRSSLGLCPQHNVLFDTLTVYENLKFFGKLKGCSGPKLENEIKELSEKIGLNAKLKKLSKNLSGGQKRKLSVGIALIGGSKVVILDEPSSGMDPLARRQMWNVLQQAREGRTVLLTTHYMDEADVLGDRIAIMSAGVVKCCGSPMFLKKLYGTGYHLIIVNKPNCSVAELTRFIQTFVPTVEYETRTNTEVTYLLPHNVTSKFPELLRRLKENTEKLKIISFGISATTMEEVFLKIGITEEVNEIEEDPLQPGNNVIRSSFQRLSKTFSKDNIFPRKLSTKDENASLKDYKEDKNDSANTQENIDELGTSKNTDLDHSTPPKTDSRKLSMEETNPKTARNSVGDASFRLTHSAMDFNTGFIKKTGIPLEISRMRAVFVKKAVCTWRSKIVALIQIIIPPFLTYLILFGKTEDPDEERLPFNLDSYGKIFIPYSDGRIVSSRNTDLKNLYRKQFCNCHTVEYVNVRANETFDNYTLRRTRSMGLTAYVKKMLIGMEVTAAEPNESVGAIAYYSIGGFHTPAISVNYLMNTLVQFTLNESFSIHSALNPKIEKGDEAPDLDIFTPIFISVLMTMGVSFLTSMFIYFLIKERKCGAKHMQIMTGISPITYWIPTFLWDFISYLFPVLLIMLIIVISKTEAFLDDGNWAVVFVVLVLHAWAMLPFLYTFQFVFKSPPAGVVVALVFNVISGVFSTMCVSILRIPFFDTKDQADKWNAVFRVVFPTYNLGMSLASINSNYYFLKLCEPLQNICSTTSEEFYCCKGKCGKICFPFDTNYLSWDAPGVGSFMVFAVIQGAMFLSLVMVIDYNVLKRIWYAIWSIAYRETDTTSERKGSLTKEDSDVAAEKKRILSSSLQQLLSTDSLILINLCKKYFNFTAVDHVCVGIPEQECFGLLGQNGAGKTTIFKMLTGDILVTAGNAYLKGYDIKNKIKQVQRNVGYCPQFDAMIEIMTGQETLVMYARLRGVPEKNIPAVIDSLAKFLTLDDYLNIRVGHYSGGNKRKLSTAIALIGDPLFILLDEPSSNMDPGARQYLWKVLSEVRASGRTLVLTSHSMEECEALCTRIAIMVNGNFKCLGSPQYLKNKFGQGYILVIRLSFLDTGVAAPNGPVIDYVLNYLKDAQVFDEHEGYIHLQVPEGSVELAEIFAVMEDAKKKLNIEDYCVQQTTLEQVFLSLTKTQFVYEPTKGGFSTISNVVCCCCRKKDTADKN